MWSWIRFVPRLISWLQAKEIEAGGESRDVRSVEVVRVMVCSRLKGRAYALAAVGMCSLVGAMGCMPASRPIAPELVLQVEAAPLKPEYLCGWAWPNSNKAALKRL
jgi:hypothetical protein